MANTSQIYISVTFVHILPPSSQYFLPEQRQEFTAIMYVDDFQSCVVRCPLNPRAPVRDHIKHGTGRIIAIYGAGNTTSQCYIMPAHLK